MCSPYLPVCVHNTHDAHHGRIGAFAARICVLQQYFTETSSEIALGFLKKETVSDEISKTLNHTTIDTLFLRCENHVCNQISV